MAASCGPSLEYASPKIAPDTVPDETSTDAVAPGGDLQVVMVDVGQGDGLVVISPNRKVVIIDTGIKEGGRAIVAFLGEQGIRTVDLLVLTHPHADHIGGANTVLDSVEVLRVLDPGTAHQSATYQRLFETFNDRGIPVLKARRGRKIKVDEGVEMTILAPFDEPLSGTRSDANANSIVMRLTYGDVSILFTGDSEAETEEGLIEGNSEAPLRSTVLKVAHHGSGYASTQPFLELVTPKAALISCGVGNSYGHPNADTMARLLKFTPYVFRTDEQGTVSLITDGKTLTIAPTRGDPATLQAN
jgi:competence protein ComEC